MSRESRDPVDRYPGIPGDWTVGHVLPVTAAAVVYVAYVFTHTYPAYGAGLFLETAEAVAANGYGLPSRIPGYTAGGVPFAYPPFAFYVLALLIDGVGLDPIGVARALPGLLVIAYLLPYRGIAGEFAPTSRQATLATLLFATAPPVLKWHLSGGGVVRALAFLFALSSVYAGIRTFRTHAPRWVAAATLTFGLVVLTHPTYAVFVVVSYLAMYAALDRTLHGLAFGAVVGFGGIALAAPWWLQVAAVHGIGIFATAAGTHGGLGAAPAEFIVQLTFPFREVNVHWPSYAIVYLGGLFAVWKRRWFLPAWLVALAFVVGKNRFLFVPGALLGAALVFDVAVPAIRSRCHVSTPHWETSVSVGATVAGIVALGAVIAGTLYGAGLVSAVHGDGSAQPQFIDADDRRAMEWTARNTPTDATFVVVGDAAEWLPFVSDRTLLVGPWGVEWKATSAYYAHVERFTSIASCRDAGCLSRSIDRAAVRPDYVYVPTGRYTVRGKERVQAPSMSRSLEASDDFDVVFENEGVVIVEVVDGKGGNRSPRTG